MLLYHPAKLILKINNFSPWPQTAPYWGAGKDWKTICQPAPEGPPELCGTIQVITTSKSAME